MAIYLSSEATITAKVKVAKLKLWGDRNRDGDLDADTLASALTASRAYITAALYDRYGDQILDWDIADESVPDLIQGISDKLTIYEIASGSNAINESVKIWKAEADNLLKKLGKPNDKTNAYDLSLPEVSDYYEDAISVTLDSVFDALDDDPTNDDDDE